MRVRKIVRADPTDRINTINDTELKSGLINTIIVSGIDRFVETSPSGGVCNPETAPCIGGFARLATVVRQAILKEPNSLLLNGGDSFQGTIWYNLLRWNVTQDFMNMLPHDAHVSNAIITIADKICTILIQLFFDCEIDIFDPIAPCAPYTLVY